MKKLLLLLLPVLSLALSAAVLDKGGVVFDFAKYSSERFKSTALTADNLITNADGKAQEKRYDPLLEDYCWKGFLTDLDQLESLKGKIDKEMIDRFNAIKYEKKKQLCEVIRKHEGVELSPDFVFDVQVKRLHEYKRQLLNAFSIMDIYFDVKEGKLPDFTPTAFIFGAKAAPGYWRAKSIIRYINRIAKLVNNDPDVNNKMKVVFVQNYNCSYAEHIIPAADISEQISPAGTEASGTGNMKFMLNGAVTLGR